MKLKSIFLSILFLLPLGVFAQENEGQYVETKAVIKSIEKKRAGRKTKEFAIVSFTTEDGKSIETMVELMRVPFLGSFKSAGDEITVNYNVANPALAQTNSGHFLSKYGMYILILLGIVFFVMNYMKAIKKK